MEWIFAALLFVLGGNDGLVSPDQTSPVVNTQEQGSVSIMTGGGGFPPPKN
jgi:hypothetical protein